MVEMCFILAVANDDHYFFSFGQVSIRVEGLAFYSSFYAVYRRLWGFSLLFLP